jgi:hypothetical protein
MLAEAGVRVFGVKRVDEQGEAWPHRTGPSHRVQPRRDPHVAGHPQAFHHTTSWDWGDRFTIDKMFVQQLTL